MGNVVASHTLHRRNAQPGPAAAAEHILLEGTAGKQLTLEKSDSKLKHPLPPLSPHFSHPHRGSVIPLTASEAVAPQHKVSHAKGRPAPTPWRGMLLSPAVWAIVANNFAFHYAFYVVMNWLPTYFNRHVWAAGFCVGQVFSWWSALFLGRRGRGRGAAVGGQLMLLREESSSATHKRSLTCREGKRPLLVDAAPESALVCCVPCCAVLSAAPAVCCGWIWRPWVPSRHCPTWLCLV